MDWKYIPKKDKIAFAILLVAILFFSFVNFRLSIHLREVEATKTSNNDTLKWFYSKPLTYNTKPDLKNNDGRWDINTITFDNLLNIYGGDSVSTMQLISYRNRLRGFHDLSQLMDIRKVNQKSYQYLTDSLGLSSSHDSIYINTETFESLLQHPYLNYAQCLVIVDIRERKAPIKSMKRLSLLDEFRGKDLERLIPYISFSVKVP